ncbi:hypothetical protein [Salinibacterium sp. ZJ454]|uniref:hypothetical protein n=1 Tax=Salinibacterium sp. ZJ454 TaxID=2708339 RepID=UPI0032633B65
MDEINRGPAVAAFGPSLVALESDKRLDADGAFTPQTQTFELLDGDGNVVDFALPAHLYLLGAMNQADSSVEPLDVAFLRRFAPFALRPKIQVLLKHLSVESVEAEALPDSAQSAEDVYRAVALAWSVINRQIGLVRGDAYQIGHGVFMFAEPPQGLPEACAYARAGWEMVRQHVDELFFGDTRSLAALMAADSAGSPYKLEESTFGAQHVVQLVGPEKMSDAELFRMLKSIARS